MHQLSFRCMHDFSSTLLALRGRPCLPSLAAKGHGPQAQSRGGAAGAARSALALDGGEGPWHSVEQARPDRTQIAGGQP